jgi:hypothetical protein
LKSKHWAFRFIFGVACAYKSVLFGGKAGLVAHGIIAGVRVTKQLEKKALGILIPCGRELLFRFAAGAIAGTYSNKVNLGSRSETCRFYSRDSGTGREEAGYMSLTRCNFKLVRRFLSAGERASILLIVTNIASTWKIKDGGESRAAMDNYIWPTALGRGRGAAVLSVGWSE